MSIYLERKRKALMGGGKWWLGGGTIDESAVIAAYQFQGAADETAARSTVAGIADYPLTNKSASDQVPTWSANGFKLPGGKGYSGLLNTALNKKASSVKSCFVKYSGLGATSSSNSFALLYAGGTYTKMLFARGLVAKDSKSNTTANWPKVGVSIRYGPASSVIYTATTLKYETTKTVYKSGVAGFSNNNVYYNGELQSCSTMKGFHIGGFTEGNGDDSVDYPTNYDNGFAVTFGNGIVSVYYFLSVYFRNYTAGYTIQAAALFNKALTADQAAIVSNAMMAIS